MPLPLTTALLASAFLAASVSLEITACLLAAFAVIIELAAFIANASDQ